MKVIAAISCVVALCLSLGLQAGAASLVGQWTFDGNGGTDRFANKAPGVSWAPLSSLGAGATVSPDGKLVLARYQDGQWKQSSAWAMLKTDLGTSGGSYFKEMTQVLWIKWPGFDTNGFWGSLSGMVKSTTENYDPTNQTPTKSARRIVMKASDNNNWYSQGTYEKSDGTAAGAWTKNGGSDPPTDRYIKLAQVVRVYNASSYAAATYWDIGGGLVMVGTETNANMLNANIMSFGQCGTPCIPFPGNPGLRYDAFGFMDFSWTTIPQSAGEILFEEARVYAGAMTTAEIGALAPAPFVEDPTIPEPSALIALATGIFGLAGVACRRRR